MTLSVARRLLSPGGFAGFFSTSVLIVSTPHTPALFIGGLSVLKNHRRGDQDFLLIMGDELFGIKGLSIYEGG